MLVGVDEVGRGALAGPVMCGAAARKGDAFPIFWSRLRDSKQLTRHQREELTDLITKGDAMMWAVAMSTMSEIDALGIEKATQLAGHRAVASLVAKYSLEPGSYQVLVDGDDGWGLGDCLVKGDDFVKEISAASIIAKVVRDSWMTALHQAFPEFGWDSNVGYGSQQHMEALRKYGPTAIHRMSFKPVKAAQDARQGHHGENLGPREYFGAYPTNRDLGLPPTRGIEGQ